MPNHWHLLLQAQSPRGLDAFVSRVKQVQTQRWHGVRKTWGEGRLYQGRFHSKALEDGEQVLNCCRYVERNALAANLVPKAEDWPWGSLWHRVRGDPQGLLDPLPVDLPASWRDLVNAERA
jgi:putative transposase